MSEADKAIPGAMDVTLVIKCVVKGYHAMAMDIQKISVDFFFAIQYDYFDAKKDRLWYLLVHLIFLLEIIIFRQASLSV